MTRNNRRPANRKSRKSKNQTIKIAQPPGTLVYVGDAPLADAHIQLLQIGVSDQRIVNPSDQQLRDIIGSQNTYWLQVDGIHDIHAIARLGEIFSLHPLVQEDILDTTHRPKADDYEKYLYITLKLPRIDIISGRRWLEQVSLILGNNYIISFREAPSDVFQNIERRVCSSEWEHKIHGVGYLLYAILDITIDNYYAYYDVVQNNYEDMEANVLESPSPEYLRQIMDIKYETVALRKSLWPLRDILAQLERHENKLMPKGIVIYLRDVYDHVMQLIETADNLRDLMSATMDIYLSSTNNRINEVMKVLTIIATLFMPLTFLTSLYGMNFEFMPELRIWWAYPALLILMLCLVAGMVVFFRRRKWL